MLGATVMCIEDVDHASLKKMGGEVEQKIISHTSHVSGHASPTCHSPLIFAPIPDANKPPPPTRDANTV
jgi:hypothetical protein